MNFRDLIPREARLQLRLLKRIIGDIKNGDLHEMSKNQFSPTGFQCCKSISQELKNPEAAGAKLQNFECATRQIESVVILPNELFSFWKIVGRPTVKSGFVEGRTIVNGKLVPSVGGGLCQLAGLMYHLSLLTGLEIKERHNHSVDLYTEETRYTPLGSDATVVYGYKDLRFKNNTGFPIQFRFVWSKEEITASICSTAALSEKQVEFQAREISKEMIEVSTWVNNEVKVKSRYFKNKEIEF